MNDTNGSPEDDRPEDARPDENPLEHSRPESDAAGDFEMDSEMDRELGEIGQELRAGATPLSGHGIAASAERRRVTRLQRSNRVLAAVAAVLAIAMIGGVAWARTSDSGNNEFASGATLQGPQLEAAEKLVATLPDQPIDPHKVKLVSSVSRFDTCDALAQQLRKVGAAHVGSQGFGNSFGIWSGSFREGYALDRLAAPASRSQVSKSADAAGGAPVG
ncbi:MAG TPA: hypothetical protein VL068_14235, partial [Microthrixaceae bacterium]|nr:hypothetical protein [Microthrixaceae bacterium]